ncbi:MAG: hypothetical protein HY906_08270, partial [Deltaproteobacteria bacterium]|nr:hypothetical protein [Deltaproteobacteria bacterium]
MRGSTGRGSLFGAIHVLAAFMVLAVLPAHAEPPPFTCDGLPVDGLVEDLGREYLDLDIASMTREALWAEVAGRFAIGKVDCRMARLLDALDQNTLDADAFPSLAGLPLADQRMTVVFAVVRLGGEFEPDCGRVRQLVFAAPHTLAQVALALNAVNGRPLTDAEVLAQPFEKRNLVWELSRSLDRLEGLKYRKHGTVIARRCDGVTEIVDDDADSSDCKCHHPHGGVISGPESIVANPAKQLVVTYRAGERARLQQHQPREAWEIGSQAELDALMTALGDATPPAALQLGAPPDFTSEPSLTVAGASEPFGFVVAALAGVEVVAPLDGTAVIVPPGAVATATVLGFTLASEPPTLDHVYSPVGPTLELTPSGAVFVVPVTVQIPFSKNLAQLLHAQEADVRVLVAEAGAVTWEEAVSATVDWANGLVQAQLASFSYVSVVVRVPGDLTVSVVAGHAPGGDEVAPEGSEGTVATNTYLTPPHSVVVDSSGTVYFIETGRLGIFSGGLPSRISRVRDGQLTTVYASDGWLYLWGMALDGDHLVFVEEVPGSIPRQVHLRRLDPNSAEPPVDLFDFGARLAHGVTRDPDPRRQSYYVALLGTPDSPDVCQVVRADVADGSLTPVMGTTGGCGSNGDLSALRPVPGTHIQLNIPAEVAGKLLSAGQELLFVSDAGNRRVLALNISPTRTVTVRGMALQPGEAVTIVGGGSRTPPSGIGGPPEAVSLCAPTALTVAGGTLAFMDFYPGPVLTRGPSMMLLADLEVGAVTTGKTSVLTAWDTSYTEGEFPVDGSNARELKLGGALGLSYGGPAGQEAFYVADMNAAGIYKIGFRDTDGDGVGDSVDNCRTLPNPDQDPGACRCAVSGLAAYTRTPTLSLTGTCGVPGSLTITGGASEVTAVVDPDGHFAVTVPLRLNQVNELGATQYDTDGHLGFQGGFWVTHDDMVPQVAITSPANGAQVTGPTITVSGTVSDATPTSVTVKEVLAVVSGGTFTAYAVPVSAGVNTIRAVATDAAGNVGAAEASVSTDRWSAAATIDATGGTVAAAPQGALAGAAIIVPPGAVSGPTTVGLSLAPSAPVMDTAYGPVGPALQLVPPGQVFNQAVTLVLPFSTRLATALRTGPDAVKMMRVEASGGAWSEVPDVVVDWSSGLATAQVTQFSWVQTAVRQSSDVGVRVVAGLKPGVPSNFTEGGNGPATLVPLGLPRHVAVDSKGRVFFVERPQLNSSTEPDRLRMVADGLLTTIYRARTDPYPGAFYGLALEEDGAVTLLITELTGQSGSARSVIETLNPDAANPQPLELVNLEGLLASGIARDPLTNDYFLATPWRLGAPGTCRIYRVTPAIGAPNPVPAPLAGTADGCGSGGADPTDAPQPGTSVQLDLPFDVDVHLMMGGRELLFITDTGNRRVLALNVSSNPVTLYRAEGQVQLATGELITIAGSRTGSPPAGVIGDPATTLSLCGPAAATVAEGVLAFTDSCVKPGVSSVSTVLLMDPYLSPGGAPWTARLTGDYTSYTNGEYPVGVEKAADLKLGAWAVGLAYGGRPGAEAFYVTD